MPRVGLWHWLWWHPVGAVLLSPVVGTPSPGTGAIPAYVTRAPPSPVAPCWPSGHAHCHTRVVTGR